jgi:hypothetical protein
MKRKKLIINTVYGLFVKPKVSVSNFKNIEFGNIFKGFNPFEFLKFETRWDCRSYRIYGARCHAA